MLPNDDGRPLRSSKQCQANVLYIHASVPLEKTIILVLPMPKNVSFHGNKLKEKSSDFMLKENIRKRKWRANITTDLVKHNKYKV